MQLHEILSNLETTPIHFNVVMIASAILFVVAFLVMSESSDNPKKVAISFVVLAATLIAGLGTLAYTETSKDNASKEAKVSRVDDKIRISSDSEFMKSVDLDVVAEKDGYIYVEFNNKTYRIEDLSKKGS